MSVALDRIPALPTRARRALGGIGSDFIPYIGAIKSADIGAFNFTTTGLGTFGNLDVDTLNFNGNIISDSTGTISFDNENLITTGNITGAGLTVADDQTVAALIGKAKIGADDSIPEAAWFSHRTHTAITEYSLINDAAGVTILNASTGQWVGFRIGNVAKMVLDNASFTFLGACNLVTFSCSVTIGTTSGGAITDIKDEDNMASDSQTALATQQSIKAYVGSTVSTGYVPYTGANANVDLGAYNFTTTGVVHLGTGGAGSAVYLDAKDGAKTWVAGDMQFTGTSPILSITTGQIICNALAVASTFQTVVIQMFGIIYPNSDATYDMGYSFLRFKDVFLSGDLGDGTYAVSVAECQAAYDHVTSTGENHSWLDQSVTTTAAPIFGALDKVGAGANYLEVKSDGEINLYGTARVINALWIGAEGVRAPPTTKPATYVEHGIAGAWEFSDATDDTILATMRIPNKMDRSVAPSITLGWSSTTQSAFCEWQIEYLWRSADEDTTAGADDTLLSSTDADASTSSATAEGMVASTFPLVAPSATDICLHLRIKRRADLPADTINGDTVELMGICLSFTSNKLGTAT